MPWRGSALTKVAVKEITPAEAKPPIFVKKFRFIFATFLLLDALLYRELSDGF